MTSSCSLYRGREDAGWSGRFCSVLECPPFVSPCPLLLLFFNFFFIATPHLSCLNPCWGRVQLCLFFFHRCTYNRVGYTGISISTLIEFCCRILCLPLRFFGYSWEDTFWPVFFHVFVEQAFFSTPALYTEAKHASGLEWSVKQDDFFPYADCPVKKKNVTHVKTSIFLPLHEKKNACFVFFISRNACFLNVVFFFVK